MKKITLMFFMLLSSFYTFAQLAEEGFDTTGVFPPTDWTIDDNGIGPAQTWQQALGVNPQPSYEGAHAAYVNRENVAVGIPEDWLITPQFNVPPNAEVRFFSRLTIGGDDGTLYRVLVTDGDPTDLAGYTLLQEFTELEINPAQTVYTEVVVPIVGFEAQDVHVAFVMAGDNGDRWLIDNVSVVEQCLDPTDLAAAPGIDEAELSWNNPGGATSWEIEILGAAEIPDGTGITYNGDSPYTATQTESGTPLAENTDYKYYLRALCDDGGTSEWVGPFLFSTVALGATCEAAIEVTDLPYSTTDNTSGYDDDYSGSPGTDCGSTFGYLNGDDVVYEYTAAADGTISIDMTNNGAYSGMFIYDDCADIGVNCVGGGVGGFAGNDVSVPEFVVTAGETYYIVISTWASPQTTPYTLTIQQVFCAPPVGEPTTSITQTSANLSWTNPSGATSWEVVVQTAGTGIPAGAGTTVGTNVNYLADGLTESTLYEYYVRADCNDGNFSAWSGPYQFGTACGAFTVPFFEGFNSDSPTQLCWTVLNLNDDGDVWNMDYAFVPFEGDQSAAITTDFNFGNNDDWLISPTLTLTGNQRLKFHQRVQSSFEPNEFEVLVSTTGADPADFTITLLPLAEYDNVTYVEYVINIVDGGGVPITGDVNIAWHIPSDGIDGWRLFIDNVIVEDIPSCPDPTDLTAGNFQPTAVDLSWTAGFLETDWEIVVQAPGAGEPTVAGEAITGGVPEFTATETTADNVALTPNTAYEYYIRANCGVDDLSNWVGPFEFSTACEAFPVPFFEGFNSDSDSQNCWLTVDVEGPFNEWDMDYGLNAFEGDQSAAMSSGFNNVDDDWLISPTIILTGNQRLKFHQRIESAFSPNDFEVLLSTTGSDVANFTLELIPLATYTNTEYVEYIVNLVDDTNTPITGNVNIAWHMPSGGSFGWRLYVDNVIVEDIPSCPDPTDFAFISATNTSADFSWTAGFLETAWEIVVQAPGTGEPTVPGTAVTGDPEHTETGLTENTVYEVYLRANCGVDDLSNWVGPIEFTTACDPFTVPFFEGFNSDSDSQSCWLTVNVEGAPNEWNMDYTSDPFEGDESAVLDTGFNNGDDDWLISPTILLTGNQRLRFRQKVQSSFSPNDFEVLASTTGTALTEFTIELIPLATYTNTDYVEYVVNLEDAGGTLINGPVNIAWHAPSGGSFGWRLLVDNVIIQDIPTCPEPTDLTVLSTTTTSAQLDWIPAGTETQWEVAIQAPGLGEPTEAGTVVTDAPPYTDETLEPSTAYEYYVRADCGDDDLSYWSGPFLFVTAVDNDNCEDAIDVPVNDSFDCDEFVSGTLTGSTSSGVTQTCSFGAVNHDVWYSFVAESETHSININNIEGGIFVSQIVFEGDDCGALTQLSCGNANQAVTGLTVGNTYYVMVYLNFVNITEVTSFDICITTPVPPITVSDTEYTIEELVQDVLIGVDCAIVSNVTSVSGSDFGQSNSIGYFADAEDGNFAFSEGIVLATGGITEAPGPMPGTATADNTTWPGDDDLSDIIAEGGNTGSLNNATVLEFDFVPFIDEISFNFLFASDEYGTFQCTFSDAFAFILTGTTTSVDGDNLAVIPDTTIPVSVVNIRDSQYNTNCDSQNVEYFGQFNQDNPDASSISYNGQTVQMQATAPVTPGESYHIKLVIADYNDSAVNSAVFLDGGSFAIGAPDLGGDLVIEDGNAVCEGEERVLDTEMDPDVYDFTWFQDGVEIEGETEPTLTVTESGTYTVEVLFENTNCSVDSEVIIEYYDPITVGDPEDLTICDASGFGTFDLSQNDALILDGIADPENYTITYHDTEEDAENGDAPIGPIYDNVEQFTETVYVLISNNITLCNEVKEFQIITQDLTPEFDITDDLFICEGASGTINITATNYDPNSPDVSYTWTFNGAPIDGETSDSLTVTDEGAYEVTIDNTGCEATATVNVTIVPTPIPDTLPAVTVCDSYELPVLTVGNYFTQTGGQGAALSAGDMITSTQEIYIYAVSADNADCTNESSFTITVNDSPEVSTPGNQTACDSYTLPALTLGNYYTQTGGAGTMLNPGDAITSTQTLYIYAETGTTPNCTGEESFEVTIIDSPEAQVLADVTSCDSYVLEALDADNNYFTAPGGTGTALSAGDVITSTQTLYIYAQTGTTPNCTDESTFVVNIIDSPAFSLGGPYNTCVANNVTINVEPANFNTAEATYAWTLNGTPLADTGASVVPTNFGTYEVTVTVGICTSVQSIAVTQDTNAIAVMFEEGCEGGDYMITIMDVDGSFNPDNATYVWSGEGGFTATTQTVTVPGAGNYTVTVTTQDGCIGGTTVNVLDTSCSIPRGISPNNDDRNDKFDLTSLDVRQISIFNRYGKEVFSYGAYTDQWHGQTNDGDELPTGTYFYSIERSNGESKTGWVYINREE
ncbi:choice-of-anchor J domain-containing protein [Flavobacterium litorale]|uniref:Choice-of-anchor J domain-containing protein n=1 Tax=Flavobacterium litorale TaxID=2856519 RepID=A0ABX8V8A9_9FLAO|nr:choice-of-anchor J domain-containing protein [Flavobacterium litorale]QYJ68747.1 choice-of-anchor J domain-containing protein [Flavobacterium litorale]